MADTNLDDGTVPSSLDLANSEKMLNTDKKSAKHAKKKASKPKQSKKKDDEDTPFEAKTIDLNKTVDASNAA